VSTAATTTPTVSGLRAWQVTALDAMATWTEGSFLINAAPGAGKTRPSLEYARRALQSGAAQRVVIVCPTGPLTRQWAEAAAILGVHVAPDSEELVPPRDFHGIAVTYARVAASGARWAKDCTPGTLVIADEAHHLGEELAWGQGFSAAFARAQRWLLLSGTPFRSDATPIPGVRYDSDGLAEPDISYGYADAVREGVCRPVGFIAYDGTLSWRSGDDVIEAGFDTILSGREASRRYRTAISTELPDGLPRILREAHAKLLGVRMGGHKDAGGLVIAADGEHAKQVAKLLRVVTGKPPTIVLHTEARAAEKLARFTASKDEWIVAVNMVSEGVDIPRLRVGVYASAAKTAMIFRQIVGRFVRTIPGRPAEMSWLYIPADPILRTHASEVEDEVRPYLRRVDDEDGSEFDERPERTESERGEVVEFVPLAAEVSSQMTLFGGGAPAKISPARKPVAIPVPAAAVAEAGGPAAVPAMPAYQRRRILRDKRHSLVNDLRRRNGGSPQEINAWLNRETGVTKVGEASIEQLERSIELLMQALTKRAARGR
jgi:superfamily II DNA or RNA helicase